MKKIISLFLVTAFVLAIFLSPAEALEKRSNPEKSAKVMTGDDYDDFDDFDDEEEESETLTSGNYEYKVLKDGTVSIEKYNGWDDNLIIPSELNGKKVTVIEKSAFVYNDYITDVVIPNGVISIGECAFEYCRSLSEISFPKSLEKIEDRVFDGCTCLKNIKVDGNNSCFSSIDGVLFNKDATELIAYPVGKTQTSYTIPNSVKTIDYEAFDSNPNITRIIIPDSVIVIRCAAFFSCKNLSKVEIGNSVSEIESQAFDYCDNLKSVTLPDSIISIGDDAMGYANDGNNNKVKIDGFTISGYAGSYAEYYAKENGFSFNELADNGQGTDENVTPVSEFKYEVNENGSLTITEYIGKSANVVIPKKINHNFVTEIGKEAFCGLKFLKTVTLNNYIKKIDDNAFSVCTALETADLPDSLNELGYAAFEGCTSLKKIYIPDSVSKVGVGAFSGCSSAESIYIGKSFNKIVADLFYYCTSVKTVTVNPDNDEYTDCGCNGLFANTIFGKTLVYAFNTTTLPDDIECIANGAFCGMTGLTSVKIPDGCQTIMRIAYLDCSNLKSVEIPPSVTNIGEKAFGYMEGDDGYTKINGLVIKGYKNSFAEKYAKENDITFEAIGELTQDNSYYYELDEKGEAVITSYHSTAGDVSIPTEINGQTIRTIGGGTFRFSDVKSLDIPGNVRTINDGAFRDKTNLYKVNIAEGLESMGYAAFEGCTNLKSIKIPSSVTTIGDHALGFINTGDWDDDADSYIFEKVDGFTIYGKSGTEAERYANEHGFTFKDDSLYVEPTAPAVTEPEATNPAPTEPEGTNPAPTEPDVTEPGNYDGELIPGDVNYDGKVNMKDVTRLQKYINKWDVEIKEENCDVNGDDKITMKDIILLQKYINKWDVVLK